MKTRFALSLTALMMMTGAAAAQDAAPAPMAPAADAAKPVSCQALMDQENKLKVTANMRQQRMMAEETNFAHVSIMRHDEAKCIEHMQAAIAIAK